MSLVDSSQQWFPTSVQVTVHQAQNLRAKGKHDSNDAYAIIQVAKDKFSTSVVEKSKAPMWKEEASFDLPLFHPGNVERCTLYLVVMHRVQGGLDKFLGQAVVNLLDLHENTARHKPAWFPLVDKNGKADKLRGDVLLGISFFRSNMSASMVDLSAQEKHHSRLSKLGAKLRLKKQKGLTDSSSDIMPPVNQVLTDSEGELDSVSLQFNQTPEEKSKSKVKKFFSLNSNLKRKTLQSPAPFGTQIEKNSSRSSSRSSGINVETPEAKKKFKFPGHKRSGSSDSKVSLGALSLLSRSKRSNSDLNDTSVNGNQKYEDAKSGSSLSLNSSGQGSAENVHQHTIGAPVLSFRSESQNIMMEKPSHQEEEERRQMEARSMAEAVRLQEEEEEEKRRAEARILQERELRQNEDFERNRHFLEDEARLEQLREEEEERARLEAAEDEERLGLEEQTQRAEDQKRQEEASMSERLSSLFGMLRKKEDRKEETQQYPKEELTTQAPHGDDGSFVSSHQLEDISLSSSPQFNNSERLYDDQKPNVNPQTPSAMLFLNRTPKVSTVKPRLTHSQDSEYSDSQPPISPVDQQWSSSAVLSHSLSSGYSEPKPLGSPVDQQWSSPVASEFTLSSVPSDTPDTFSNLHSSLAPVRFSDSPPGSPSDSIEKVSSVPSLPTMTDQIHRPPLPPLYPIYETSTGGTEIPTTELNRHSDNSAGQKLSLPLPDYETLFPQKRHGVQGHTRWDHIIAQVNQRNMDYPPELMGPELSVDGPDNSEEFRPSITEESPALEHFQTHYKETRHVSSKKVAAPPPPNPTMRSSSFSEQNIQQTEESLSKPLPQVPPVMLNSDLSTRKSPPEFPLAGSKKALLPPLLRPTNQMGWDTSTPADQTNDSVTTDQEAPTARPRQRVSMTQPTEQHYSSAMPDLADTLTSIEILPRFSMSEQREKVTISEFDPLSKDPWAPEKPSRKSDDIYAVLSKKEQKPENRGVTADDLDQIFSEGKPDDRFSSVDSYETSTYTDYSKREEESRPISPVFQRRNSQKKKKTSTPSRSNSQRSFKSSDEEQPTLSEPEQELPTRDVLIDSITQSHPADGQIDGEDPFDSNPFAVTSAFPSSEPLPVLMEEPSSEIQVLSARKTRGSLPPADFISSQISNGGDLASTLHRPHPVKPMHSTESQVPIRSYALKDLHFSNGTAGEVKTAGLADSGPFTQLTHEELITLVVRQQADLSKKESQISELEEYIDNLLVRVIEEKPTILQALKGTKPV
ncbi:rab11 family-interacting protein 1-like isoform X1 [Nerophis ophidion]|uniref:rab11 family-interacting protein 1-like isoform X1 n=1 Tax=Nerophis ophidion TaxID=159077 RepID=UPI002ADFB08D|nr:rab11 family-interacting protein 1-like isoform X1 [Nerophis ophidion]